MIVEMEQQSRATDSRARDLRIVCLADTHGFHDRLAVPDGDILVHAGDVTARGGPIEIDRSATSAKGAGRRS